MIYVVLCIAACLFIYCWWIEPRRFRLRRMEVSLPWRLQQPLKVLHLSDLHLYHGRTESLGFIHSLQTLEPDIIFITGDLIESDSGIPLCIEALSPLHAKYGIFAVLGNHDYYHMSWEDLGNKTGSLPRNHESKRNDVRTLIQELNRIGVQVLQNERRKLIHGKTPLFVVGIDDPYVFQDDIEASFDGLTPTDPCLVLVHSPENHPAIAEKGVADMVFCGHTHGGQINLPGVGPLLTRSNAPRRFAKGLVQEKNTLFFTSTGLGTGPLTRPRFNCPPEAVWFELLPIE